MKTGALFAGYGGIELAVHEVLGAEPAWFSEFDAAPSRILAHHWPDVPNLGDVTAIDWAAVEPVDIITGGSPCQDLSHAGKRAGMRAGTRSGLWASMCDAIDIIRPRLVVWENVRGALSASAAAGDVESCEFCVDADGEPPLRALGRVLGDLAELGYDAAWVGLRAADVGAPHGRFRIFVLAWPAQDADRAAGGERRVAAPLEAEGGGARADVGGRDRAHAADLRMLPTPTTRDVKGRNQRDDDTCLTGALLPTPRASDGTKGGPNQRGSSGDLMLPSAVQLMPTPLLPTPTAMDSNASGGKVGSSDVTLTDATVRNGARGIDFGAYAGAIARWEPIVGRPAPSPTEATGKAGAQRLSPAFVEWMMGLPAGWVTDVDITRNEQLKALGNGVVPQQCAAAVRHLLGVRADALAGRWAA